jgi:hypothetical protein
MHGLRFVFLITSLFLALTSYASDSTRLVADYGQLVNQGIDAYQQQDTGLARLSWERALLIDRQGSVAEQNIAVLLRNMPDEVVPVPDFVLSTWWSALCSALHPHVWMGLQVIVLLLVVWLVYRRWYGGGSSIRSIAVLGLLSLILYLAGRSEHNRRVGGTQAVVMHTCTLHAGPDDRSDELLDLSAGQKLYILNRLDGWLEVARMDRVAGWIQVSCLEEI